MKMKIQNKTKQNKTKQNKTKTKRKQIREIKKSSSCFQKRSQEVISYISLK